MDQFEADRTNKLNAIRELGIDPYGGSKHPPLAENYRNVNCNIAWCCWKQEGGKLSPDTSLTPDNGPHERGQGRVVLRREMGNLHFLTVRDVTGDLQVAISKKKVSEKDWKLAKLLDLGDVITFEGRCAPTKTGEPTLWAESLGVAAKSLLPPPAKVEGLTDVELRYRNRHVDLWSNVEAAKVLLTRSKIVRSIRDCLNGWGYVEVETPILQVMPGGAAARPFVTHHGALDIPLYMRIAPELYLKRLIVGGFQRVFEIGRNFRNEGISTRHNPEFTALECYEEYSDYEQMMDAVEHIVSDCIKDAEIDTDGIILNSPLKSWPSSPCWRRVRMDDLVKEFCADPGNGGLELSTQTPTPEDYHKFYENHVERTLTHPTFVTHLPASKVPLAKHDGKGYALAFEFVAGGVEIGCGYTEQNDPHVQLEAFKAQNSAALGHHLEGKVDEVIPAIDTDFVNALKVGMPPCGGLGIGIDRLVMWLTRAKSVRDVILFPTMKPEKE